MHPRIINDDVYARIGPSRRTSTQPTFTVAVERESDFDGYVFVSRLLANVPSMPVAVLVAFRPTGVLDRLVRGFVGDRSASFVWSRAAIVGHGWMVIGDSDRDGA